MEARVLVVDGESEMVERCSRILRPAGHRCLTTTDAAGALGLVDAERPDVLVTDVSMPGMGGTELLQRAQEIDAALPVIVTTPAAATAEAMAALRGGAFDYLPKPFSADQLRVAVDRALRHRQLQLENRSLRRQLSEAFGLESIIGRSPAMTQVFELARRAARSQASILVAGEPGTGKELVARAIHANGARASRPFVPVDCASRREQVLESELFGREKGAVDGGLHTEPGLIEMASGGTLFLAEIGELPLSLQGKLLRAIQDRQTRRVGGAAIVDVDVRVVSATTGDVREAIGTGRLREDLHDLLSVVTIELPPLRARRDDIPLLAHAFLHRYGQDRIAGIDHEALAALEAYGWPGNVRQLRNVIERACALADADVVRWRDLPGYVLGDGHLPAGASGSAAAAALDTSASVPLREAKERWLTQLEGAYLRDILARHDGNVSAAAKTAGIDRKTLHRLINRYHLR
jgi:DNA-binding NtrC family response regulator